MKWTPLLPICLLFTLNLPILADVCNADVNQDSIVDQRDYDAVFIAWADACQNCATDVDRDGSTTILDLFATEAAAGTDCARLISTELAGNTLASYPFFEYVLAFNQGSEIQVAVDTGRFPSLVNQTVDIYVVEAKTFEQWEADDTLTDATPDDFQSETFTNGTITANTFTISGSNQLSGDAGQDVGRPYDVVIDVNRNGRLDGQDLIDGLSDPDQVKDRRHGLYVIHDLTLPGPHAVTEISYSATVGSVTAGFEPENIFYPTQIASMGRLPLIVISHGNGHNFEWYDHLGLHMASYGYVVMSHANNTVPGVLTASTTTLEHTDAFIDQLPQINGGVLVDHVDTSRITWLGHSRGGEGVAIAVDRIFDGDWTPVHYTLDSLALVSSIAPVDFLTGGQTDPHGVNYHLWTGGSDDDVNGCADCNLCQTFHLHDRAEEYRQSISLHGAGHGAFHNGSAGLVATGPCQLDRTTTHAIMRGHFLPLVKHYVEGNVPAREFLWRQWERFKPIGAPTDPCVVVDLMYREAPGSDYLVIDDFQSNPSANTSSSGGTVNFDVTDLTEGRFDDGNNTFTDDAADPMNSITLGGPGDDTAGVVFSFDTNRFYEQEISPALKDFSAFAYLDFRAAQASRHPLTTAELGDVTFDVTLTDGGGQSSTINIGVYGGGIEEPYQRPNCGTGLGWAAEFETIRIRLTDFIHNNSGLDLTDIAAIRLEFGPAHGSAQGRIAFDDLGLSKDMPPPPAGRISIVLQDEVPELVAPSMPTTFTARISSSIENVVPGSPMFHYSTDGGANFVSVLMNDQGNDLYSAVLPAVNCGDNLAFYFTAEGDVTGDVFLPRQAPVANFTPQVGSEQTFFTASMDTDPGWTTEGLWAYGQNTGGGGSSGNPDPTMAATGTNLYGFNLNGDYPNSLPETHLTSTAIDCSAFSVVKLSFQRFLGVETDRWDHAYVRVSTDGVNFTTIWENNGEITDANWVPVEYDISAVAAGQSTVFLRWTMGTTDTSQVYCGWNIDDVMLSTVGCP